MYKSFSAFELIFKKIAGGGGDHQPRRDSAALLRTYLNKTSVELGELAAPLLRLKSPETLLPQAIAVVILLTCGSENTAINNELLQLEADLQRAFRGAQQ